MPRHFGLRKRREIRGGKVSNIEKLDKDFVENMHLGKAEDDKTLSSSDIRKKFSI